MIDRRRFWLALSSLALGMVCSTLPGCSDGAGGGGELTPTGATKTDSTEIVETPEPKTAKTKAP